MKTNQLFVFGCQTDLLPLLFSSFVSDFIHTQSNRFDKLSTWPFLIRLLPLLSQTDSIPMLHLVVAFRNAPQGSPGARPKVRINSVCSHSYSLKMEEVFELKSYIKTAHSEVSG